METEERLRSIVRKTMDRVKKKYPQIHMCIEWDVYYSPENYFVSYIFRTDRQLAEARDTGLTAEINDYHKTMLKANGYPDEGIQDCSFDSKETCDREYNGNWYYYFK